MPHTALNIAKLNCKKKTTMFDLMPLSTITKKITFTHQHFPLPPTPHPHPYNYNKHTAHFQPHHNTSMCATPPCKPYSPTFIYHQNITSPHALMHMTICPHVGINFCI